MLRPVLESPSEDIVPSARPLIPGEQIGQRRASVAGDADGDPVEGEPDGFLGLEHQGRPPGFGGADRDQEGHGHLLRVFQARAETDHCLSGHGCLALVKVG